MTHPKDITDLVSFWDFQEAAGQPRRAIGSFPASLREGSTPIVRVPDGIFGEYSAQLSRGQYFHLPHAECGELRLQHGLSVVAWLQRHRKPEIECEAVAGMWNETERQQRSTRSFSTSASMAAPIMSAATSPPPAGQPRITAGAWIRHRRHANPLL